MKPAEQERIFDQLVREHGGMFWKLANAFAPSANRDDLHQEILLSLWQALPAFRGESKASTFAYRVAHNCALTWTRGESRRQIREAVAVEESKGGESGPGADPRVALLYDCLHQLPALDRSIITMSLDGLTHAEIASVTGSNENAVGVRIHRARNRLATAMKGKLP